jgi:N-formylglutamate amidohydrolase
VTALVYHVGRGAPESPVILHVPHASRVLTGAARERILLDDSALSAELDRMTDAYTDLIAARVAGAAATAPWTFVNRYSRLVVDPERFPDDREEMLAVGMGAVYTRTSYGERLRAGDADHTRELLATHFEPYASAIADLVDDRLAGTGRALLIDVHSYPSRPLPYELHGTGPRPAICLGTDPDHTPAGLLDMARRVLARCGDIGVDTPFAGCYVPLRHHRRRRAVTALMVEIRRDTYLTEPAGPPTGGLDAVVDALTVLVDALSGTTA